MRYILVCGFKIYEVFSTSVSGIRPGCEEISFCCRRSDPPSTRPQVFLCAYIVFLHTDHVGWPANEETAVSAINVAIPRMGGESMLMSRVCRVLWQHESHGCCLSLFSPPIG